MKKKKNLIVKVYKSVNFFKFPISVGIVPESLSSDTKALLFWFFYKWINENYSLNNYRVVKFIRFPISAGMVPVSWVV